MERYDFVILFGGNTLSSKLLDTIHEVVAFSAVIKKQLSRVMDLAFVIQK